MSLPKTPSGPPAAGNVTIIGGHKCNVDPQITWFKYESCAVVEARGDCPEHTGACCDGTTGICQDLPASACPVNQSDPDNQYRWEKDTLCAELSQPCVPHRGACCDNRPINSFCADNVLETDCTGEKPKWFAKKTCAEITCVPNQIPTVSDWGMAILALLLLTGAKIYFGFNRRRLETAGVR